MKIKEEEKISTSDIAAAGSEARLPARRADEPAVPADDRPHAVDEVPTPLFANEDAGGYRTRWSAIQTGFVDEPRNAVEQADSLVAEVMQRLAKSFADERGTLEGQWSRGEDVDTEALRVALRRYRAFFDRLLAV